MKGFKERTTGLKWETIVWRDKKFRVPSIDDGKLFHDQSDIQRFSKFKENVVKMFIDFCKQYELKVYSVGWDDVLQPIKIEDVAELAKKYQTASFFVAIENTRTVNDDYSLWGISNEYSMYLDNYDANTGESTTDYIAAYDNQPLTTLVSRAMACRIW